MLAFLTMIRIAVAEDLQYLVWPCSGRRTACCQVERGSILFYLYQSILVVGIDGKDGDRLSQATLTEEVEKALTSHVQGLAERAFRNLPFAVGDFRSDLQILDNLKIRL